MENLPAIKKQIAIFEHENLEALEAMINEFLATCNGTMLEIKPIIFAWDEPTDKIYRLCVIYAPSL